MTYVTFRPENLNRLASDLLKGFNGDNLKISSTNRTDIYKNDKSLVFEIELPGFSKEEINVSSKENKLTISATKKSESNTETNYFRKERTEGKVERSFFIPEGFDLTKTSAKYENGLLTISISELVKQEREIEISVN